MKNKIFEIIILVLCFLSMLLNFTMVKRDIEHRAFKTKLTEYYYKSYSNSLAIESAYKDSIMNAVDWYVKK